MKHYLFLLLVLLAACAEPGGSRPAASSSSSDTFKSTKPATSPAASSAPAKRDKLENSSLLWKPTTTAASLGSVDLTGLGSVKLQVATVADGRQNQTLLGENKEKAPPRRITTTDDVPAFVTQHMRQLIAGAGINVVDNGATRILKTELKQFYVEETDLYKGEARMVVTLTDGAGKTLWTGTTAGSASRFGRSYKAENYFETLSDSLIEATYNLLRNPGFHDALAK